MSAEHHHHLHASFTKAIVLLTSGTVTAHAITALALPVATRLYSPSDFTVLSVFSAVVSVVSVAACLRFDTAIAITTTDDEAWTTLALATVCALTTSCLAALVVALIPSTALGAWGYGMVIPYAWALAPAIFAAALASALQSWFLRRKAFGMLARTRVFQSMAASSAQIGLGAAGAGPWGLLVAYLATPASACLLLGARLSGKDRTEPISRAGLMSVARAYSRFPKYSTWEALFNSAAIQVPVILIASMVTGPEAGHLMLAMYVMQIPMALVGNSVGQAYLAQAPQAYRDGGLVVFTLYTLRRLGILGTGPLLFAGLISPAAFMVIFGSEWQRAGEMVLWMTPWFIAQFLSSPLSMALHITGNQAAALRLQAYGLLLRVTMVCVAAVGGLADPVAAYAASGFIFYGTYLLVVLGLTCVPLTAAARSIAACVPYALAWGAAGLAIIWFAPAGMAR